MDILPDFLQGIALIMACTAFVKIATVLSIARYGLGLYDFVFSIIVIVAASVLAVVVAEPLINSLPVNQNFSEQVTHFDGFLKANTDPDVATRLQAIVNSKAVNQGAVDSSTSTALNVASFIVSELKEAFQLGLMLLVPFIIIDLLVMNILMLLGVTQISVVLVALPLKLLLFISVDGWTLITEKLLSGYLT